MEKLNLNKKASILFVVLIAMLSLAMAQSASAGPGASERYIATDFWTAGLDANGAWKSIYCTFAKMTLLDGVANETYHCEFDPLGSAVLPDQAMTWNYENSLSITGPWRWYSDIEDINNIDGDPTCFWYTQAFGDPPGDSSWSLTITPSGKANSTVKYRPVVLQHGDGPLCE